MTYVGVPNIEQRILEIANRELTIPQLKAWLMHINGLSQRDIAFRLDVSRTTVVDRLDAAWRKLRAHGVYVTPDGQPYLQETA